MIDVTDFWISFWDLVGNCVIRLCDRELEARNETNFNSARCKGWKGSREAPRTKQRGKLALVKLIHPAVDVLTCETDFYCLFIRVILPMLCISTPE